MAAIDAYQAQKTEALAHLEILFNDETEFIDAYVILHEVEYFARIQTKQKNMLEKLI